MTDVSKFFSDLENKLSEKFGDEFISGNEFHGTVSVSVKSKKILDILEYCVFDVDLKLTFLTDLTAVDYLEMEAPGRLAVVYCLRNVDNMNQVLIKAFLPADETEIDSAVGMWSSAEWLEREVWDLFGIKFKGNPNLKRILLPDDYEGHPLLKDYPLKGRGERDSFKVIQRESGRY
ncbi:MAG: NADH-quinone oxidoreductase subunit C [Candidatus Marinimicrobia bacterium]|nr:NADH-quinone oxidoreductase subunit C [Candidatus Neomarinimicrobiota bacterium]